MHHPTNRITHTTAFVCNSRGALAGTRNSPMGPPHEGSIRRPISPWSNALTTELPVQWTHGYDKRVGWVLQQMSLWWWVVKHRTSVDRTVNYSFNDAIDTVLINSYSRTRNILWQINPDCRVKSEKTWRSGYVMGWYVLSLHLGTRSRAGF